MSEEIPEASTDTPIDLNALRDAMRAGEPVAVSKPNQDGMTPEHVHYVTSPHFMNPDVHGPSGPPIEEVRDAIAAQRPEGTYEQPK